jgi:CorA-like Mg2+ transporter protein
MPLTLITGIYGMNFEVMPELHYRFGHPAAIDGGAGEFRDGASPPRSLPARGG